MPDTLTMPDTNCPRWCVEDHTPAWQDSPAGPWTPLHRLQVGLLDELLDGRVEVALVRLGDRGTTALQLIGDGTMTAASARELAAVLLDAAAELAKVQR